LPAFRPTRSTRSTSAPSPPRSPSAARRPTSRYLLFQWPIPTTRTKTKKTSWRAPNSRSWQHLVELRDRLLYCVYGLVIAGILLSIWPGPGGLIDLIAMPIKAHMPHDAKLIAIGVFSPFFVPLKVLMMTAVLLALPWLMYQAGCSWRRASTATRRSLRCR
jgi:hypothetical protein